MEVSSLRYELLLFLLIILILLLLFDVDVPRDIKNYSRVFSMKEKVVKYSPGGGSVWRSAWPVL